jgi:hypothetical protein
MTTFAFLLLVTILQFVAGMGILSIFRIEQKPLMQMALSVLLGIAFFSFVPFVLQLFYVPLTQKNIFVSLITGAILFNSNYKSSLQSYKSLVKDFRIRIKLYEIPFLLFIAFLIFLSVWRCFYLPPTPRDLVSGPEVIAEYAVKEKTLINSVFTVNLETTNNQFKPPYITSLQIIYKYLGFHFGQIWLSPVFICFILFLYNALNQKIHRLLTGFLLCVFIAVPEMYAYTIMALFDYSNAVFLFLSFYFLFRFFELHQYRYFLFSGLLLGIATYIRSETLVLAFLIAPLFVIYYLKNKPPVLHTFSGILIFILPAILFYWLSVPFYIDHYLPVKYQVTSMINKDPGNLTLLWDRLKLMNTRLIFSETGISYYGYFIYLFLAVFVLELITQWKLTTQGRNWLYAILVVYIGLAVLGWLMPLFDLESTTRRGMLKIFPLMLLFFGGSKLMINLSNRINNWEQGTTAVK